MPLSRKLTFSFTIAILISIFIISFISNTMINRKFDSYLIEEQNMKFEKIRKDINNLFLEEGNNLTSRDISNYASMEGIYIEIRDYNDDLICHSNNSNMMHRGMYATDDETSWYEKFQYGYRKICREDFSSIR